VEYIPDNQPEYADDTVNVNRVLSWRRTGDGGVLVEFRNIRFFDSAQ
jgi:hypothetical protein